MWEVDVKEEELEMEKLLPEGNPEGDPWIRMGGWREGFDWERRWWWFFCYIIITFTDFLLFTLLLNYKLFIIIIEEKGAIRNRQSTKKIRETGSN